jgi:hypothetical protein
VQAIAQRRLPGCRRAANPSRTYLIGLGELYVSDPRFAANYDKHGAGTAAFVREAMTAFAEREYA